VVDVGGDSDAGRNISRIKKRVDQASEEVEMK
jgi:hypothetical protein